MARIIYNNIIPFPGFQAITILPFVFARKKFKPLLEKTINHEGIHLRQQSECLVTLLAIMFPLCAVFISLWWLLTAPFAYFVWYGIEYVIRLCIYGNQKEAYRNISFEQEAFLKERDFNYFEDRKSFAWFKYITKKTYRR